MSATMTASQIDEVAKFFVASLDNYARWAIHTGGLAFTTYEDTLETLYGEENLIAIEERIYHEIRLQAEGDKP